MDIYRTPNVWLYNTYSFQEHTGYPQNWQLLVHKARLNKWQRFYTTQIVLFQQNALKLEINKQKAKERMQKSVP